MLIPWSSLQMENNACEPDRLFAIWPELQFKRQLFCVHFIIGVIIVVTALQTCVHVVDRPIVGSF